jgi:hypothetical protein
MPVVRENTIRKHTVFIIFPKNYNLRYLDVGSPQWCVKSRFFAGGGGRGREYPETYGTLLVQEKKFVHTRLSFSRASTVAGPFSTLTPVKKNRGTHLLNA